jgi:hypothetical protein
MQSSGFSTGALDLGARDLRAEEPHRLRRRHAVLVAGGEQHRAGDAGEIGGRRIGKSEAAPRVAVGILAHQRFTHEADGGAALRLRLG